MEDLDYSMPISGLICTVCGYNDSLACFIDHPEEADRIILCGEHAAKNGYCCCCGVFCSGLISFEFHHPGYCDNCYDEVKNDRFDDDDDYYTR